MTLVVALTILERSVRRYQRSGTWEGVPVVLTATEPPPTLLQETSRPCFRTGPGSTCDDALRGC